MDFTEKLNRLLSEKKISKPMLAKLSGIPYTTIMSFFDATKGTENIKLSTLKKLSKTLNVSLDYLTDDNVETFDNAFVDILKYIATDDSMAPLLNIDDVAYIVEKNSFENGETILFELENIKYIRKILKRNTYIEFHAMNPYFPILSYTEEELNNKSFKIIGKVIKVENKSAFK